MPKNVVIIGAGPAGLLLAHYLARRSEYKVHLCERRSQDSLTGITGKRTFPISLQERGRKALRGIPGLESAIATESVFCQGSIIYRQQKKPRKIKRKKPLLTIERNLLVNLLLQELTKAENLNPVKIHWDSECVQINKIPKTVTLQHSEGDDFTLHYDILIGADGATSYIREYLSQGNLHCEESYVPNAYKSVFLNRCNPQEGVELEPDYIHGASLNNETRVLLVPQPDNQLNGTLIFDAENNPLESFSTKEEVMDFFEQNFPVFYPLMPEEEAEALLQRPVGRVLTVQCDRFDGNDSILLIGDAAHAVSPSIGQGCNAALEDVHILNQLLEEYEDDWSKVVCEFSRQRVPDADALQELSNYSFPQNSKRLRLEFFLRFMIRRLLHRWFPHWFQPFVFDLVSETDMPYSQILGIHQGWINKVKQSMEKKGKD